MLSFKRIFAYSLLTFACLLLAIWFGGRWWLAGSLMPGSGQVIIDGIEGEVEILFDARGLPRVYADTDADVLRALGWLHASERLFQMELLRRVAQGRIAELIGPAGLESDRLHRAYGFARRVDLERPESSDATEALLAAYLAGINARIDSDRGLPPEFLLMQFEPARWTREDVLTLAYYQTWYPLTLVQRLAEAWRALPEQFGPEASDWLNELPRWGVPSVPLPATRMTEASNTWAVAPARSTSGAALHASDPHLDYSLAPGLWYAVGLHSKQTLDLVGVTAPGLPFVAMGHNGRIAFSFTVAPVDLFEVYHFSPAPEQADQLAGPEGPIELIEQTELFTVRGQDGPISETLLSTRYGPATRLDDGRVEVLHWAGFDLPISQLIEHGLAINQASDFDQFRRAAADMGALSVNWIYSDRAGNIGYVQSTPVPKRQHAQFYTALDGSAPINHWAGFLEPLERPFALNPEQGWLANSNNHAAVESDWPMPGFYKHLRMRRAVDWLSSKTLFDQADMHAMQLDRVSDRALAWKDWLASLAQAEGRHDLAEGLRDWKGDMHPDSLEAGLFAHWWQALPRQLFKASQLDDWRHGRTLLDDWLHRPDIGFEFNGPSRDAAGRAALREVLEFGLRPLGRMQTLSIQHPLAVSRPLDLWLGLSRGPIPIGSGPGALNVTYHAFDEADQTLEARAGASMRFVMDWADPDGFTLNLTLGQSGHPLSRHFADQLNDFLDGNPWVVPFSRAAVEARTESRLLLRPARPPEQRQ